LFYVFLILWARRTKILLMKFDITRPMNARLHFIYLFAFFLTGFSSAFGQLHYYEETYNGGVTAAGWSPEVFGAGTGNFSIFIEPGSTIQAAFLIASRLGPGDGLVTLNGIDYNLSLLNQVTGPFSTLYGDPSAVHLIDVTADIDPSVTNYTITGGAPYQDFQLVVFYDNPSLSVVTAALFLNTVNLNVASSEWTLDFETPVLNADEVAMCFFNSYQCDMVGDAENITVNGTYIGTVGTQDSNSGWCTGTIGSFYYQNASITALGDDNADQGVNAGEALSDVSALVPDGSDQITVLFEHVSGNQDNHQWSIVTAFGSSCQALAPELEVSNVCLGETSTFEEISGNTYSSWTWNFGDSNSSADQNTSHVYGSPGQYNASLTVADSEGCLNTISVPITVYPIPTISVDLNGGCDSDEYTLVANGASTYVWNPGNVTSEEITITLDEPTTYEIVGTSEFGCEAVFEFEAVPVEPLQVDLTILSNPTCEEATSGSILANVEGGMEPYEFVWSPIGSNNALNNNISAGVYSVTITDARGCIITSDPIELLQTGLPEVVITGPEFICPGESVVLSASGAVSYEWSTGEIGSSIEISPESNTTYTVTGNNGLCENTASFDVEVYTAANWNLSEEYLIELGQSIQLNGAINGTYTWTPSDGLSCTNCPNPVASPTSTTLYTVVVQDAETGCVSEHLVLINVEVITLFIPNVVTLTQDEFNETFSVLGGPFRNPTLTIYNRWGNLLYTTSDPLKGWNLKIDGERAAGGTYYYIFEYDSLSGRKKREGHFTLLGLP
jgi:gliding motility-associated-like protein